MESAKVFEFSDFFQSDLDTIRILHVEDNEFDAKLIKELLKNSDLESFDITWVKSVAEGLYRLSGHNYDCIILDFYLPDDEGQLAIKKIEQKAKETPVLVLSGYDCSDQGLVSARMGAQDYLTKDQITPKILSRAIRYSIVRKLREREMKVALQHDSLTGLLTRKLIHDRITHAIERHKRNRNQLAVMYLDLDKFKWINDTFGHSAGDAVLSELAKILQDSVRKEDSVGRMGGDEFVILFENIQCPDNLCQISHKIFQGCSQPVKHNGCQHSINLSIGIALFDGASNMGDINANTLLEQADFAMYRSKLVDGNHFEFFDRQTAAQCQVKEMMSSGLAAGFSNNEFKISYDPIYNAQTLSFVGGEACLCWQHGKTGLMKADAFLPIMEELNLARSLADWYLNQTLLQWSAYLKQMKNLKEQSSMLLLTLPMKLLFDKSGFEFLKKSFDDCDVDSDNVVLNIAGDKLVKNLSKACLLTQQLSSELGVKICITDFGSHQTSPAVLSDMTCHYLKLSPSLLKVPSSNDDQSRKKLSKTVLAMTQAYRLLAKQLGLQIIVPPVEADSVYEQLIEQGYAYFQQEGLSKQGITKLLDFYKP